MKVVITLLRMPEMCKPCMENASSVSLSQSMLQHIILSCKKATESRLSQQITF